MGEGAKRSRISGTLVLYGSERWKDNREDICCLAPSAASDLAYNVARRAQRDRFGFSIIEIVVGVAILAIIGAVVIANVNPAAALSNDIERVNVAADNLDEIARAIAFFEPTKPATSFHQTVGVYPSRLSMLTAQISTSQLNSCDVTFTNQQVNAWTGAYYGREIPTSGFKIADGFIADDTLARNPATNAVQERASLSIIIPNVTADDAAALALTIDGESSGTLGAVRFTANGSNPVTVSYRIEIGGC